MNIENLTEHANWLDAGDFDGRRFDMGNYADCVLGQCAARELQLQGKPVTLEATSLLASGLSLSKFGIRKSTHPAEWEFIFGAQWGTDAHAAAYRIRDLVRNKVAPPRDVWPLYHSVPKKTHSDAVEPQMAII